MYKAKNWSGDSGITNNTTLEYYNSHAVEYAKATKHADMSENYNRFLRHVKKGGSIIDLGCGGGRDLKFFKDNDYYAVGIDASEELCSIAAAYSGCPVICCDFLTWIPETKFDAIWANASLVHLTEDQILTVITSKSVFLKEGGVFYFSMKKEIAKGLDAKGRFFTPFSEDLLLRITRDIPCSMIIDRWSSSDSLGREDTIWESVILGFKRQEEL